MELEAGSGEHEGTFSGALCVKLRNRTHMHAPLATKLVLVVVGGVVDEDAQVAYESHDDARLRFSDGNGIVYIRSKQGACLAPACS